MTAERALAIAVESYRVETARNRGGPNVGLCAALIDWLNDRSQTYRDAAARHGATYQALLQWIDILGLRDVEVTERPGACKRCGILLDRDDVYVVDPETGQRTVVVPASGTGERYCRECRVEMGLVVSMALS